MSEWLLRVDPKGRIVVPSDLRRALNLRAAVKARVEDGRLVIEPVVRPLERLMEAMGEGTSDVEREIRGLRSTAEGRLSRHDPG